jgi:hypothetical protein
MTDVLFLITILMLLFVLGDLFREILRDSLRGLFAALAAIFWAASDFLANSEEKEKP